MSGNKSHTTAPIWRVGGKVIKIRPGRENKHLWYSEKLMQSFYAAYTRRHVSRAYTV